MKKCSVSWSLSGSNRTFDDKTRRSLWIYELNAEWKLKGTCERNNRHKLSSIELHRKSLAGENMVSGFLQIYTEGKELLLKKKFLCLLEDGCLFTRIHLQYPPETVKSSPKASYVIGVVAISIHIEAFIDVIELVHLTPTDYSSLERLSDDMKNLLLKKPFLADVNLKCGSVIISAQKGILSARSPVFEAMFNCPVEEEVVKKIVIEDIEVPALQAMLEYMYTGKIEGKMKVSLIFEFIIAAIKYKIRCLESACCYVDVDEKNVDEKYCKPSVYCRLRFDRSVVTSASTIPLSKKIGIFYVPFKTV